MSTGYITLKVIPANAQSEEDFHNNNQLAIYQLSKIVRLIINNQNMCIQLDMSNGQSYTHRYPDNDYGNHEYDLALHVIQNHGLL